MPIIIDNFHVRIDAPIDNRFVVGGTDSFYSNRDAIQHKYQGLRIWDLNVPGAGPYYWTGATWSSENAVGVSVDGTTSPGYLPVFTLGPTVLGKSIIYQNPASNQIGIGLVGNAILANVPSGPSLVNGLHVAGNIRTNASFVGSGLHVTDINASNINSGLLAVNRISHLNITSLAPGEEYVLFNEGTSNSVRWRAASALSVLNSTNTTNIGITEDLISTNSYITFVNSTSGNLPLRINSSKMQFRPSNGQLFLSDGSANEPTYTFLSSVSGGVGKSGMYYDGNNIGFTKQGNNFVSIVDNGIAVKSPLYPQISFIETNTNKNRLLWVNNNDDLLFRLNAANGLTEKRVWHQDNLFTLKAIGTFDNQSIETGRNLNISTTNAGTNDLIKGVYTYNVYNTQITNIGSNNTTSQNSFFSVLSFGRGTEGSVQLASNWFGSNASPVGNVVADREILIRSLRDADPDVWSPWVKIWNSGNSGYVPFGAIMMWSGTIAQIPTGWRLCDGNNGVTIPILPGSVPGSSMQSIIVPDLRERFVVGAGGGDNNEVVTYLYDRTGTTYGEFTFMYYGSPVVDYTEKVNAGDGQTYGEYYPNETARVAVTGEVTGAYFMYNTGGNYFYYIDYNGKIQKGNAIDGGGYIGTTPQQATQYTGTPTTPFVQNFVNNTPAQPASWTGDKFFGRIEVYSQSYGFYHVYTKKFELNGTTPQVTTTKSGYWYWIFDKRTQNYVLVRGTFNGDASIGTTAGANAVTTTTTPIIYKTGMSVGFSYTPFQKYTNTGVPVVDVNNGQPTKNNAKRIQMQGVIYPTSSYNVGDKGGFNDVQLTSTTMPQHSHLSARWSGAYGNDTGDGGLAYAWVYRDASRTTNEVGGDQTHENRPPYYALAFIIYTGI